MKKEQIKQIKLLSLFLIIGFFTCFFVFASEIDWPVSPMGTALTRDYGETSLTTLVKYMYEWGISLGALAAFISIIVAGFNYLTSAGNSSKINEAKKRITASFLGIALLLGTVLILNTINPEITSLEINSNFDDNSYVMIPDDVRYESETKCAYAKLYTSKEQMELDEENGFLMDGGVGTTIKPRECYRKGVLNVYDSNIYTAVQFISTIEVEKITRKYENGKWEKTSSEPIGVDHENYPQYLKAILLDDTKNYVKAMGTECKLNLLTSNTCDEIWGSASVTFPTNDLYSTANIDPNFTQSYKLISN